MFNKDFCRVCGNILISNIISINVMKLYYGTVLNAQIQKNISTATVTTKILNNMVFKNEKSI